MILCTADDVGETSAHLYHHQGGYVFDILSVNPIV